MIANSGGVDRRGPPVRARGGWRFFAVNDISVVTRARHLVVWLLFLGAPLGRQAAALGRPEYELELDPYYTAASVTLPFEAARSTVSLDRAEHETYRHMLGQAFIPRFALLEASVNPLPVGSVLFRRSAESTYRKAKISPTANVVESIMAGFEEPYAVALFVGNVVDFTEGKKTIRGHKRKGYVGYLLSYGNYHILESQLIPDSWMEGEAKIKGDMVTESRKMSWSFRAGTKVHSSPEIADTVYLGLRRDRIDYKKGPFSFLLSSGIAYRVDFRSGDFKPLSHFLLVEKNMPFKTSTREMVFSLGVGLQVLSKEKYSGSLALRRERAESSILFRPNLKF